MSTDLRDTELWDPAIQALDPAELARRTEVGLLETWDRMWELPFYAERFGAAGLSRDAMPALTEIPRTTKGDHRADEAACPPFGRHRSVTLDAARRVGVSTGTTGAPTFIFYGPRDLDAMVAIGKRNNWRLGLREGDRFTHSWPQYLYPTSAHGGRPYLELGIVEIPVGPPFSPEAAAEHLRVWDKLRPTGFMMTASQFQTYEKVGDEIGIDFAGLVEGHLLVYLDLACQFDAPRRRIEDAYGVRLHNLSGASEVPAFSVNDSRHHRGFQVAGDHVVIEVCDPVTGEPVPDGERGHLVVSTFGLDTCFLRYDVEDFVVRSTEPDPSGETGPRYFLVGRGADAVVVDGRRVFPLDVQLALDAYGAPEFQVVPGVEQDALHVRIEHDGSGDELGEILREQLDVTVDVETTAVGSLPRAAFKPRRIAT